VIGSISPKGKARKAMRRVVVAVGAIAALAVPVAAGAHPTRTDRHNAAKKCKEEREDIGRQAFAEKYGTNNQHNNASGRNKNAFGKCVSFKAKQKEAAADRRDRRLFRAEHKAAKKCKAEREDIGRQAFAEKYGRHRDKRSALGRCVSKLARS
jgi:hypothetical protein